MSDPTPTSSFGSSTPAGAKSTRVIPPGFLPYTENNATILLPATTSSSDGGGKARVHPQPQLGPSGTSTDPSASGSNSITTQTKGKRGAAQPNPSTSTATSDSSSEQTAFLNPVQEYNRDLSVAIIKEWSFLRLEEIREKWERGQKRREGKGKGKGAEKRAEKVDGLGKGDGQGKEVEGTGETAPPMADPSTDPTSTTATTTTSSTTNTTTESKYPGPSKQFINPKFTVIEALSATGLRSVRYAQELENVGLVLANDFSPSACEAMKRNVDYNDIGAIFSDPPPVEEGKEAHVYTVARGRKRKRVERGGVVVNEGDACTLMYNHRGEHDRVDVVDLDPYGTAAPFIDAAVQSVSDGGLLCVTCTDLAVMAGQNYPEKCFANYGGTPAKAEYCHEAALRLLIASISSAASRYGRYIEPLLSLSIDFYVRIFVRVHTGPLQVKEIFAKQGIVYVCSFCQAFHAQALGRVTQKTSAKGADLTVYRFATGPPTGEKCDECGGNYHVAGPMWLGPIHKPEFLDRVLKRLEDGDKALYKTYPRMRGMMAVARDELDELFFYNPAKSASNFRAQCPSLAEFASAILNANYKISRSHCVAGSVKTNAPPAFVHDVIREFIKSKPVRKDKVSSGSPTLVLLEKEMRHEVCLTITEEGKKFSSKTDLVRYQSNPTANWGPGMRAKTVRSTPAGGSATTATVPAAKTGDAEPEQEELKEEEQVQTEDTVEETKGDVKMDTEQGEEAMMNGGIGEEVRGTKRSSDEEGSDRPSKK